MRQPEAFAKYEQDGYRVQTTFGDDCAVLVKNVSRDIQLVSEEEKKTQMAGGRNHAELLSREPIPSPKNEELFCKLLARSKEELAKYIGVLSESVFAEKGNALVIVSLVRGGTPFGALVRRYLKQFAKTDIPHYSISLVRERGIDSNALRYILYKHPSAKIQFIDGWTGSGYVSIKLRQYVEEFNNTYGTEVDGDLGVVADTSKICRICGTRKDVLIPSSFLNATVCGLMSSAVLNDSVSAFDFHGGVIWEYLRGHDLTKYHLDQISDTFVRQAPCYYETKGNYGYEIADRIAEQYCLKGKKQVRLGIGESMRAVSRYPTELLLISSFENPQLAPVLNEAERKSIPTILYSESDYECIAIVGAQG